MSATKTAKKPKEKDKKKERGPRRQERRFTASSSHNTWLVRGLGVAGAITLGAGTWAYMYGQSFTADEKLKQLPQLLIAGGAVATGLTIWLGTSAEAPLRVGDPGISMERGEVRRMPWWGLSSITWESGNLALVVSGRDESGSTWTFKVPVKSHPEAAGWILQEALDRVPKVVDIKDAVLDKLPGANPHAGMKIDLEPLQVVGKKCAVTGRTISFEPDARVCVRCERVYFKRSVPKKCKCGMSLAHLRAAAGADDDDEYEHELDDENDESVDDEDEDEDRDDDDASDRDEAEKKRG
ncbi:MAG: hypothetical protein KF819_01790 [Labilithrix sp.]|nr:hypothetical protein [Labilithrix sp.]